MRYYTIYYMLTIRWRRGKRAYTRRWFRPSQTKSKSHQLIVIGRRRQAGTHCVMFGIKRENGDNEKRIIGQKNAECVRIQRNWLRWRMLEHSKGKMYCQSTVVTHRPFEALDLCWGDTLWRDLHNLFQGHYQTIDAGRFRHTTFRYTVISRF
jgi:hypothetical protein